MKFRTRIGLTVATFVILTSVAVALAVFKLFEDKWQQEYQTWTRTLSAALAKSVVRDTREGNRVEVANLLKRVAADNPQIAYILAVDFSGQPFASTVKEGKGLPDQIMAPSQNSGDAGQVVYVNGHEILDISYPLIENLGAHLHVGLDTEAQHESRLALIQAIVFVTCAILAVALIVALFFARRAVHPITQLTQALRAFGRGENLPLPDVGSADAEVRDLAASFRDMTEARRTAKDAREAAERQLRTITDGLPVGIAYLDPSLRFVFANRVFEDWYQRPRSEIIGHSPREILGAEASARIAPHAARALAGEPVSYDAQWDYPDGIRRHVNVTYVPDREGGQVRGLIALVTDITARVDAARQLLIKDAAIENSLNGIAIANMQGNLVYVNGAFLHLWGYAGASQVLGRAATSFWTAPDAAGEVVAGLQQDGYWTGEMEAQRADGGTFITDLSAVMIRNEQGEPTHMLASFLDITQRKHAEEELRRHQEQLEELVQQRTAELARQNRRNELILDTTADGFFAATPDGRMVDANAAYCSMLGYTRAELLQLAIPDIEANESPQEVALHAANIIAQGHDRFDTRHRRQDGSSVQVEVSVSRVEIGAERLFFAFVRDITERKQAEQALIEAKETAERASRAKSEFLSRMSHELRTPMNAILGFSQVLEIEPLTAEQQSFVSEIHQAGDHLLELINELLDLSRIETGRLETVIRPVTLLPVMQRALQLIGPLLLRKNVALINECDRDLAVLADASRLRQILVNLLSNAAKYNRQGGSIRVSCAALAGDRVRIAVADTGAGIAPEQMQYLFNPFERLGAEHTEVEGSGIGLAISKRVVELMGGTIGVDSAPGQGSTFWIELPLAQAVAASEAEPSAAAGAVATDKFKVLYVEDNAANLKVVEAMLRRQPNLTLLAASNGEYGLELAQRYLPQVILLDIHLPGMDGYAVLKELQSRPETREIPVIALSADAMPLDVERGLAAGFKHYLTKPVVLQELAETIGQVIQTTPAHAGAGSSILDDKKD